MHKEDNYWKKLMGQRLSRRQLLRGTGRAGMGLVGVALIGCAAAPSPTPAPTKPGATPAARATPTPTAVKPSAGGTLKFGQFTITGFDPHTNLAGSNDDWLKPQVLDKLLETDEKGKVIPNLYTSWETPDQLTFIGKLRRGVKFHDGTDLTAEVVRFSHDRVMNGDPPVTRQSAFKDALAAIDVVDDYTVRYRLKELNAGFAYFMADRNTGRIASPSAVKKYDNDLRRVGVGTAPWLVTEWVKDDRIVLKKFPNYWDKGFPYLDEINVKVVPENTTALTMVKTGDLHFYTELAPKDVASVKADPNLVAVVNTTTGYTGFLINQRRFPFNIKALRQAFTYAVDREAIVKAVFLGLNQVAGGFFGPVHAYYDPAIKPLPYDPVKAKEKLKEGGYPEGFEFEAEVASQYDVRVQYTEAVKDMVAKIGIKMNIKLMDQATVMARAQRADMQLWVMESSGAEDPDRHLVLNLHSTKGTYGKAFFGGTEEAKEVDALMNKGRITYNEEERFRIYSQLQRKMVDDAYGGLWLVYRNTRMVHRKELRDYVPSTGPNDVYLKKVWLTK
ncbi:MAG: ABC transporter substrate-binding protein [Chloroflexi bacterium]|nr:ABC transporter substrate-binding protein [Chloroflexota bacterium]